MNIKYEYDTDFVWALDKFYSFSIFNLIYGGLWLVEWEGFKSY